MGTSTMLGGGGFDGAGLESSRFGSAEGLTERTKTSADEVAVFETQRHFCRKNSDGPAIHPKPRFWLGVNLAETGRAADSE